MRKLYLLLLCGILILQTLPLSANAQEVSCVEERYSPISGIEVKTVKTIADGGFFDYQVVTCDLKNKNLTLDLMYPAEGGNTLKGSRLIGEENGAGVVMNADYFNRSSETNKGSAVGFNQKDGKLLSNALEEQVYSFSYSDDHTYSFDIFSNQIKIGFRDEVFEFVKTYNKYSSLEGVAIFDSHWGEESLGSSGTLVELVIEDDMLKEIRRDMPPVKIPKNGFVLAGLSDLTTLFDQVQVGDKVTLEILQSPTLDFIPDFTVGGGSLLVDRGELVDNPSYPMNSTSFSAMGISQDGSTLWLICATEQKGLTLKKMGELCLSEGAYYAMNFDGGGSTQCAVKDNTTGELQYIHPLVSQYERPVANAIGVIANHSNPKPYGIRAEDVIVYQNLPRKINYTVYDENGDPMEIDSDKVKLSLKHENGTLKNGYYYGESLSSETVEIRYEGIVEECTVTTVAPAEGAVKNKDGTYTVTNGDGYVRTVTAEEFKKGNRIPVTDTLPVKDVMAENLGLKKSLSLYGGSQKYNTLFARLLTPAVLEKMPNAIYPFTSEATENEWIEIVTLDNLEGQILNKRMTEWNRFLETLETNKQNIILCLKDPVSFSRKREEELFFDAIKTARQKGKNILVVYRGNETKLQTLRDGVRVISVAYDPTNISGIFSNPTNYLKIYYNQNQMTYEIAEKQLFFEP